MIEPTIRSAKHAHSPSILVVDDEPEIREGLCEALCDEGYLVTTAANGADAIKSITGDATPDLILMDLRMPVMGGYEFLKRRAKDGVLSRIPVIVVSATIEKPINDVGVQVLKKPVDLDVLLLRIRREVAGPSGPPHDA